MELTADLFRRIVAAPETGPAERFEGEKRRAPRRRLEVEATLLPFTDRFATEPVILPLRDLSRGGFGFLDNRPLPLGEQFGLLLPDDLGTPIVILCTVAYWQPLSQRVFAIGARFCRVLRRGGAGLPLILEDAVSGERTDLRKAS